jgi:nucleotide-binding universal stress UspA family protein
VKVIPGPPAAVLLEEARARKAGMIVIGAHRKREPLDFGNTVRAVYAKSTVPVWVQPQAPGPIRRVLAAVDLSEVTPLVLAAACTLARAFGAEVRVVHCFHVNGLQLASGLDSAGYALTFPIEEVRRTERVRFEREVASFDWQDVAHTELYIEGDPVGTLLARAADADLVVLGTHGRTGLTSVVLGSVAHAVLKRSVKPTLAVQKPGRRFWL